MYKVYKRVLLDTLRNIRDNGAPLRRDGICVNVMHLTRANPVPYLGLGLDVLIEQWPKRVGIIYPIGGYTEYNNDRYHNTVWTNPRRIELLNWLITQLENE